MYPPDSRAQTPGNPTALEYGDGAMSCDFTICVDRLSPAAVEHIEEVCDRFEAAWRTGGLPRIEDFLGETPEPERSALLGELLVLELAYRRRRGDRPTSEEYRRRSPGDGEHSRS